MCLCAASVIDKTDFLSSVVSLNERCIFKEYSLSREKGMSCPRPAKTDVVIRTFLLKKPDILDRFCKSLSFKQTSGSWLLKNASPFSLLLFGSGGAIYGSYHGTAFRPFGGCHSPVLSSSSQGSSVRLLLLLWIPLRQRPRLMVCYLFLVVLEPFNISH